MNREELEDVVRMIVTARTLLKLKYLPSVITTKQLNQLLACDGDYALETKLINKWRIN